jgi:hypothetical protein
MRKISLLLIAMLVSAVALSMVPTPARGSSGNILINSKTSPSPVTSVAAGGSVNLYFGSVDFSGGQVTLYFSRTGSSSLDTVNDKAYGPTFVVAYIRGATVDTTTYEGYSVGKDWINGSIPKGYAGGEWYIKAFDGSTAAVAVTDRPLTVTCMLEVTPTSGPGQAAITLKGYGFSTTSGNHVNLSYFITEWKLIVNYLAIDANGQFSYPMIAPDAAKAQPKGEHDIQTTTVTFRAIELVGSDTVNFYEYWRGLIQVDGKTVLGTSSLYGNNTDFAIPGVLHVDVNVLGSLIIAGQYFHPGTATIKWDGSALIGSPVANGTGFFNITVTIPVTKIGYHNIIIDDTKIKFNFSVNVIPTIVLTPNKGVACTTLTVVAEGYGFTASTDTVKYHVNVTWYYIDWDLSTTKDLATKLLVDTNGYWKFSFILPHSHGGENYVYAYENDTAHTTVYAIFTSLPGIKVTPSTFPNNGTIVTISGCGLKYDTWYDICLDNAKDFYAASWNGYPSYFMDSGNGDYFFQFVAAGLDPKPENHVVALYEEGDGYRVLSTLVAHAVFTVTSPSETAVMDKLDDIKAAIDDLDTFVRSDSSSIHTMITAVQTAVANAEDTLSAQISGLSTRLTSIETYAQTAATAAASASSAATAASTAATGAKTAAEAASATTSTISTAVYGAIVLSLIAALASIVAVITLQKKVA